MWASSALWMFSELFLVSQLTSEAAWGDSRLVAFAPDACDIYVLLLFCMCVWRRACVCICALLLNLSNDKPEVTVSLNASCRYVFAGWCRRSTGTDRPPGPQGWTWRALLCRTLQWGRYTTPFLCFSFTSPTRSPLNIFSFSTSYRHKQNITQHLSNFPPLWW